MSALRLPAARGRRSWSRRPLRVAGFLFGLPNTLVGLAFALTGWLLGARLRRTLHAIEALDHPLMMPRAAISLGLTVCYGRGVTPASRLANGVTFAEHERQHAIQSAVLGPIYLPLHLGFGLWARVRDGRWHGPSNRLESGPLASPPRPWA